MSGGRTDNAPDSPLGTNKAVTPIRTIKTASAKTATLNTGHTATKTITTKATTSKDTTIKYTTTEAVIAETVKKCATDTTERGKLQTPTSDPSDPPEHSVTDKTRQETITPQDPVSDMKLTSNTGTEEDNGNQTDRATQEGRSDFQSALRDLVDPMIAVQGHGLIELTKLIRKYVQNLSPYCCIAIIIITGSDTGYDSFAVICSNFKFRTHFTP